ncbi:MAG: ROK family protein, partial [Candidatus Aenigmarchaeota archaeon]
MGNYIAGVDIGGTYVTASLADKEGFKFRARQSVWLYPGKSPYSDKYHTDGRIIPEQVDFLIKFCCEETNVKKKSIDAVGISTTSPFKKKNGYSVVVSENLCGGIDKTGRVPNDWTEIPLEEELSRIYKGRELRIENDGTATVVAERLFGAANGNENIVYLGWGTGIACGAWVSGVDKKGKKSSYLLTGKDGNALEIGHIAIADGPLCECGGYGHMQTLCSGEAIARDYGKSTKEAFEAYNEGDKRAKEVVHKAADNFAKGLATLNATFDNKVFVIGGGVFVKNEEILLPLIKKGFREYSMHVLSEE